MKFTFAEIISLVEGHVIHPNLWEVYILLNTINMSPLSWQATPFATLLLQAFKIIASFQLKYSSHPKLFLLSVGGILNKFFIRFYAIPLNHITLLLGLLFLPNDFPPLWAPSKTFEG
jgi:hypothetical protein